MVQQAEIINGGGHVFEAAEALARHCAEFRDSTLGLSPTIFYTAA